MRLSGRRARARIPIYLATLSPRMLRLTGEIADGWLGTSFVPEGRGRAYFTHLDAGLAAAGRTRADLDVCQGAEVAFAADEDELAGDGRRPARRSSRSASAAWARRRTNFYNARLQPPGLGRGRRRGPRSAGRPATGRGGRARHRRDGAGHHADRHRGDGARPPAGLAAAGRGHRAPLPGGRDARRAGWPPWPGPSSWCARSALQSPRDRHARPVRQVQVARRVQHREVGAGARPRSRRCRRAAAPARPPAVAAHSASSGVMPISRTASAIISGIDDE